MKLFSLLKKSDIHIKTGAKIIPAKEFSELLSAEEVLQKANRRSIDMLEEAEKECETLKKEAEEKGFEEGLKSFNRHIMELDNQLKQLRLETQRLILPLALKAAKKIVGDELKSHPEHILNIVMNTLKPALQSKQVKIFVSKQDKEILEKEKKTLKAHLDQVQMLSIEERADLEPGSCIIETEAGIINASMENQWRALEAAFETFMKR